VPPAGGPAASTAGTGTSNGTVTPASLGPSGAGYDPGSMTQPNPDNMITAGPAAGASSGIPWGKVALIGGAGLVAYFLFFRNG